MNGKIVNGRKLSELYIINIFNMMEEDMNKPYDVGFICGRFQTFHKGHEKLVETGLMLCDRLLIFYWKFSGRRNRKKPIQHYNQRKNVKRDIWWAW